MQPLILAFFEKPINNFVFAAYNNSVEEITITQNGFNESYMAYLFGKVKSRFSFLPGDMQLQADGEEMQIRLKLQSTYCPYVRKFAEENIADVLAIGYKYHYLQSRIRLPLLTSEQRHVLLTALVAADYKEDKAYIARRIVGFENYCLDGVFHFRLQRLQTRWDEVISYVPADMGAPSMDGFMEFLAEDGEGKIFIKDGKVYNGDYLPLTRSALTGKVSVIGEVLLGGAEQVYCFGEVDGEVKSFLKKYYGENAIFC